MFKSFFTFLSMIMLSASLLFASSPSVKNGPPPRQDLLDKNSQAAQIKLSRAEHILATLVPDPQSYHLILSSNHTIGAEAIPPHIFSDKPTMIVYQGTLSPNRSNEELAFVMAHELGHLNLHHGEKMCEMMEKTMHGPIIGISGITFSIFHQKLEEQQADLFGLNLYMNAGYDPHFFQNTLHLIKINPNIHYGTAKPFRKELPSLSMKNSHFNMMDRFQLLATLVEEPGHK